MTVRFDRCPVDSVPDPATSTDPARCTVYQTPAWLAFLTESQHAEPVVAAVSTDDGAHGWFVGAVGRRAGLRMLGSPLPGWTTSYMGFVGLDEVDRHDLLAGLRRFAFRDLRCAHLETMDRSYRQLDGCPVGYESTSFPTYELALGGTDDDLLAGMTAHGRRDVRRAVRNGIVVEVVAHDDPTFVTEYYTQVTAAFARRRLTPTYSQQRVSTMIRHLGPTPHLVLLRARTANGEVAATGMFPGVVGGIAEFWMGASERHLQHLLPNEALMFEALRHWHRRGAVGFEFGGGGHHKAKYGGSPVSTPWLRSSLLPGMGRARQLAVDTRRRLRHRHR